MIQPFFTRAIHFDGVGFNGTNNSYCAIRTPTTMGWDGETDCTQPWSVAGTFTTLSVYIVDQVGGTTDQNPYPAPSPITYYIRINGVDTGLSALIDTGTSLSVQSGGPVSVSPGDTVTLHRTGPNFPQYCEAFIQVRFSSTNPGESAYGSVGSNWGAGTNRIGGANYYYMPLLFGLWQGGAASPKPGGATITNSNFYTINAIDGNLTRYDITLQGTPEPGESFTFTVLKNGIAQDGSGGTVDTRLTISHGSINGFAEFTLPIALLDCLSLQVLGTVGTGFNAARVGCRITASTDGQWQIPGNSPTIGNNDHIGINGGYTVNGLNFPRQWVESDTSIQPGYPFVLQGAILWLGGIPGAGKNWSVRLRSNYANAGPVATCSDSQFRAIGSGSATIATTDFLDIQTDTTAEGGGGDFGWNFLIGVPGTIIPPVASALWVVPESGITVRRSHSITVVKRTSPHDITVLFNYSATGGLIPATFSLRDGQRIVYHNVLVGTYGFEELLPLPLGWTFDRAVVSNGNPVDAIVFDDTEDIVVVFFNVKPRGKRWLINRFDVKTNSQEEA